MPTCPRCNGEGFKMVDEGGGPVKDSCYHCAETGQISATEARADQVQGLIKSMMCSPTQPAIARTREMIEIYKTLPNPQTVAEQDVDAVRVHVRNPACFPYQAPAAV